ncbi:MAG TPA: enoyl-CoA hydratase-related protein [Alphaproteobacteria bacterium]|nr:enoyl-CoA hydratase-related protein [Alphaproteobacteria bacterium]
MAQESVIYQLDLRGVATVTLNRPDKRNAFDDAVIERLHGVIDDIRGSGDVRVVLLTGRGKSFCAGADLGWMKRMAAYSAAENTDDARRLSDLLAALNGLSMPTVALVQGAAMGGGAGLVACCDIAIAVRSCRFAFSEVNLGLIPAMISPYVLDAIGARAAQRYFLTGEAFDGDDARRIGLVHELVASDEALAAQGEFVVGQILESGPEAAVEAKKLIRDVAHAVDDDELRSDLACRIAERRASTEGQEGMAAFFERRKPRWAG